MKSKKKSILFFVAIFAVFTVSSVYAQETTFETVCASLATRPITKGDFSQTRKMSATGRSLTSNGTFLFSLDGIIWRTQKPFPSTMIVGMTSVIQETADGRRTVIDASGNQIFTSMATTLSSIFSGNISLLKQNFSVAFSVKGNSWTAELTPLDSTITAVMKSITVSGTSENTSDKKTNSVLTTIVMTEAGGSTITYSLTNLQYPKELTNDERATFATK